MDGLTTTMTIPLASQSSDDNHDQSQSGGSIQSVSVLAVVPTLSQPPSEPGATVYVAGSTTPKDDSKIIWNTNCPPNNRSVNSSIDLKSSSTSSSSPDPQQHPAHVVKIKINPAFDNTRVISTVRLTPDQIDPRDNNPESDECNSNKKDNIERVCAKSIVNSNLKNVDSCVRISVINDSDCQLNNKQKLQREDIIQPGLSECVNNNSTTINRSSTCFYYGPFPNLISTMSSGQCSPSDTLDSGTCSDLDSTPPPLPKKKNGSTVILDITKTSGQHNRTGSLTSSGAEIDSDDNESNISCDSLNSGELAGRITEQTLLTNGVDLSSEKSRDLLANDVNMMMIKDNLKENSNEITMGNLGENVDDHERGNLSDNKNNNVNCNDFNNSNEKLSSFMVDAISSGRNSLSVSPSPSSTSSFSKSSSTPRVRSPNPLVNGRCLQSTSPVVKESTYEDRKKEQILMEQENATAEHFANYNRNNGTKYVYEDDRFYKFHINELEPDNDDGNNNVDKNKKFDDNDMDEYFAGFKILDKEAIRSAKGTVRGVKNRVRAGIATFLQNPSSKVS
ncbi:hypothetical protein PV325_005257 [Microctonus aethiopoides]|nr:hypothetical protein PV325_005257 [Microctonus aethiopoides]